MAGTTEEITRRKEAELAFLDLQETLEHRVRERTADLEQAVRDLQEEIGRRQQTEVALKASEQRYHALYEHNPTMYFTLTPDGTVLSVNRFGAEELGYREDELAGQSVLAVFQAADHHTVLEQLRICSQSPGRTFDWEIQKVRKGGQLLWVKERARAITGPDGSPIILIVCEDITEQRQTQELIRDRDQQLQATTQFLHTNPPFLLSVWMPTRGSPAGTRPPPNCSAGWKKRSWAGNFRMSLPGRKQKPMPSGTTARTTGSVARFRSAGSGRTGNSWTCCCGRCSSKTPTADYRRRSASMSISRTSVRRKTRACTVKNGSGPS
jgi:PAS domain S-box-containing protein